MNNNPAQTVKQSLDQSIHRFNIQPLMAQQQQQSLPVRFLRNVSVTIDDEPRDVDVLCGSKSKTTGAHPGNELLRRKIEASIDAYHATTSLQQRITLNRSIVTFMRHTYGTRFLKAAPKGSGSGSGWMLAEDQAIRDKISHALRFAAQQRKKQEQDQESTEPLSVMETSSSSSSSPSPSPIVVPSVVVPCKFERQQEILQRILQPNQAVPAVVEASFSSTVEPTIDSENSANDCKDDFDHDNYNQQDEEEIYDDDNDMEPIPLTMASDQVEELITNQDNFYMNFMNHNNNNNINHDNHVDPTQVSHNPFEITDEDEAVVRATTLLRRRESQVLPHMAALVSQDNLDFQAVATSPRDHRKSAVAFASVLQSLHQL